MRAAAAFAVALVLASTPAAAITWAPRLTAADYRSSLENYLRWYHKAVRVDRLRAALELVDPVVEESFAASVNPAIVASLVTHESSWRPAAIGKLREVGLLQVMRGRAKTPREQLAEGLRILAACHERCGTVAGAISCYATGHGCRVYRGAKSRIRLAERIEEEF